MKKISMLLVVSIFIVQFSFSSNKPPIENYLNNVLDYPETAKANNEEGFVLIEFAVFEDGSIDVLGANSNSNYLMNYVISKISSINLNDYYDNNQEVYLFRFDFKLL